MPKKNKPDENTKYTAWSPRVSIFIDGSNLYHSLDENCRRFDLDFKGFAEKLAGGRELHRVYYYNVQRDSERNHQAFQDQQKFFSALYNTPYFEVRLGTSKQRGEITVEKGVDIMLATDLLQMSWNNLYDVAILVSGDGDFAYAVQQVKNTGKHVEVAAFPSNVAWELTQVADDRILFTPEFFKDLWTRKGASVRSSARNGSSRQGNSRNENGNKSESSRKTANASDNIAQSTDREKRRFGIF